MTERKDAVFVTECGGGDAEGRSPDDDVKGDE